MLNIELKCGISCFKVRLVTLILNYSSVILKTGAVDAEVSKVPDGRRVSGMYFVDE